MLRTDWIFVDLLMLSKNLINKTHYDLFVVKKQNKFLEVEMGDGYIFWFGALCGFAAACILFSIFGINQI